MGTFHKFLQSILSFLFPSRSRLREIVGRIPEDILIEVISRLPAKDTLRCRCVCKQWRDLTATHDFLVLQVRRSIPMVLAVVFGASGQYDLILLDNWKAPAGTAPMVRRIEVDPDYRTESSHNGLIVMQRGSYGDFKILNSINGEIVRITLEDKLSRSLLIGVFFHPLLNEYCAFWRVIVSSPDDALDPAAQEQYKVLNLGPRPSWIGIKNRWSNRSSYTSPVLVEEYFYWVVTPEQEEEDSSYAIMEFNVRSEELDLLSCPAALILSIDYDISVKLLNVHGVLSLVLISPSRKLLDVTIWTLENRSDWSWTSYSYKFGGEVFSGYRMLVPIAICDGELLLDSDDSLFVCNLKLGTTREFGESYDNTYQYLSHVMSVVSLKNCKPNIHMVEEGEVQTNIM